MIQESITLMDFQGNIANGAEEKKEAPCVGHTLVYGVIASNQNVTIFIDQGTDQNSGPPLAYNHSISSPVLAGVSQAIAVPIVGKFLQVRITNASGFVASVEAFFELRGWA